MREGLKSVGANDQTVGNLRPWRIRNRCF